MSTDDSISEDVSTSAALSHENAETSRGKESEASILSSEEAAPGLAGPEEEHAAGGSIRKLRGIFPTTPGNPCLGVDEGFNSGRTLPSINPSPIDTLTALVKEIQSSGEANPEIWKNCEGRWLQLFQLVEKQYQDQILGQQEQYQCQIQLIQDEIKALVQLQHRQSATQNAEDLLNDKPGDSALSGILNGGHSRSFVLHEPSSVPSGRVQGGRHQQRQEDPAVTLLLSSGYGTLSASEHSINKAEESNSTETTSREKNARPDPPPSGNLSHPLKSEVASEETNAQPESRERLLDGKTRGSLQSDPILPLDQSKANSQPLTSWAQKQQQRTQKSRAVQDQQLEDLSDRSSVGIQEAHTDARDEFRSSSAAQSSRLSYLRKRNDSPVSLVSEASGLTYWKLDENELYHPLPDSIDNGSYLFFQEGSMNLLPKDEQRRSVSLKEIYHSRQREDKNLQGRDSPSCSNRSAPQVLTLDPTLHMKPSDRITGFTSSPQFSSPSFPANPKASAARARPVSPDSMAEAPSQSHTDSDCTSNASSFSAAQVNGNHKYPSERTSVPNTSWTLPSTSCQASHPSRQHPFFCSGTQGYSLFHAAEEARRSPPPPRSSLDSQAAMRNSHVVGSLEKTASLSSLDDPVVLSLVRQNLREKHSRHIADLRAYYESEINSLKQKLDSASRPPNYDGLEKTNRSLLERCDHLERALTEASSCIRDLENKNRLLEKQLVDWPERYDMASATVQVLQQHLDEVKNSNKEKDNTVSKLKGRVRHLEEAFQNAYKVSDDKEVQMKKEHKMLQDLLMEYESLGKEHERVKDTLVSTENKLFDANAQISELKRIVSKLEAQIRQLEHENIVKTRHAAQSHSQASGAGLYHHPDVLHSPSKTSAEVDVSRRKWLNPGADYSIFTGRPLEKDVFDSSRCYSPPEKDSAQKEGTPVREPQKRESPLTPVMKALIELDDIKGTEGRALRKSDISNSRFGSRRPTVSFVEGCSRESALEKGSSVLKKQRSLSPVGHRSSSLPPCTRKSTTVSTPTKRDTMITPLSAKSSPKRCPTENFSPGFNHLLGKEENSQTRFDVHLNEMGFVSASPSHSPRKRLQFMSQEAEVSHHSSNSGLRLDSRTESALQAVRQGAVSSRPTWEEDSEGRAAELLTSYETQLPYQARLESLAETERLFDELTREKQQIEAALSRIPGGGGRVTLQARLDEEALEDRLEKINRDLGSIRMTLKRFHVLRTSANL
ncbi:M-phase phosphoprotein 9 isoform X1 [Lepisosteus oculatus]|uniref:M-phase phosphoprotein 9 isoform X1 n=1 Tax=Lepisosteus oculatus TaxID=7918 RepID=UPI0035F527D7